jgi:hypothetical protein
MFRKIMIACVAVAAIAASAPTTAEARWGHGGGWHGGWHGGGWGWGGPRFYGGYGGGYYPYAYGGYPSCYRSVRVYTPYGPRWRRVWVCG